MPSSITASTMRIRCSCAMPTTTSTTPTRRRRRIHRARRYDYSKLAQHRRPRTTGSSRRALVNTLRMHFLDHNLEHLPTNYDLRRSTGRRTRFGQNGVDAAVLPAPQLSLSTTRFYYQHAAARHQVRRRLHARAPALRGALLRARRVHVHHRHPVRRQRPADLAVLVRACRRPAVSTTTTRTRSPLYFQDDWRLRDRCPPQSRACATTCDTNLRDERLLRGPARQPALRRPRSVRLRATAATTSTTSSRALGVTWDLPGTGRWSCAAASGST